jgi:radical SAM superfamily enzyme YgiQ (UPF0313 family)
MRSAGCQTIWFGVESGSPTVLKSSGRNITLQQAVNAFKKCKKEGIQTACSFMLGIPGETRKDMDATLKFAKKLNPDWCQFNIFIAYPGCTLYNEIMEKHLYDRMDGFLAYVKTKEFDFESLLEIQKEFHKAFYRSPKRIIRKIKREGTLNVLKQGLNMLKH